MLVSVHLPKTAGSSFGRSLRDYFGDRLYRDYGDVPVHTPLLRRRTSALLHNARVVGRRFRGVDCIHGHFLPAKYRLLRVTRAARFVMWMRDPVERLASHYHFWTSAYDPQTALPLHRRVVEENWSFERFARSPELRNIYTQFLWGFPLSAVDFIGITEHYDEDFPFFTKTFLGVLLPPYHLRTNPARIHAQHVTDPGLRAELEQIHHRDVLLYRHALALRRARAELPRALRREPPS